MRRTFRLPRGRARAAEAQRRAEAERQAQIDAQQAEQRRIDEQRRQQAAAAEQRRQQQAAQQRAAAQRQPADTVRGAPGGLADVGVRRGLEERQRREEAERRRQEELRQRRQQEERQRAEAQRRADKIRQGQEEAQRQASDQAQRAAEQRTREQRLERLNGIVRNFRTISFRVHSNCDVTPGIKSVMITMVGWHYSTDVYDADKWRWFGRRKPYVGGDAIQPVARKIGHSFSWLPDGSGLGVWHRVFVTYNVRGGAPVIKFSWTQAPNTGWRERSITDGAAYSWKGDATGSVPTCSQ